MRRVKWFHRSIKVMFIELELKDITHSDQNFVLIVLTRAR
jgi:hypothetical protein